MKRGKGQRKIRKYSKSNLKVNTSTNMLPLETWLLTRIYLVNKMSDQRQLILIIKIRLPQRYRRVALRVVYDLNGMDMWAKREQEHLLFNNLRLWTVQITKSTSTNSFSPIWTQYHSRYKRLAHLSLKIDLNLERWLGK